MTSSCGRRMWKRWRCWRGFEGGFVSESADDDVAVEIGETYHNAFAATHAQERHNTIGPPATRVTRGGGRVSLKTLMFHDSIWRTTGSEIGAIWFDKVLSR
jgi:hypothetical protein